MIKHLSPLLMLMAPLILAGCAAPPDPSDHIRQALLSLGNRAADQVMEAAELQPPGDQVLLLAPPEVDASLSIGSDRVLENLTRALLGVSSGPQVLDWRPAMAEAGHGATRQWRLESRLEATAPRLQLSDRDLLPYRLTLTLHRPDADDTLWQTEIEGAFDATAL
jgi:hypothetical protein